MGKSKLKLAGGDVCTGCGACALACAKNAIVMRPDREGFYYPDVSLDKCVGCGICAKICPVVKAGASVRPIACYAAKSKDDHLRMKSSSGGIFGALAKLTLRGGGVVCGCAYDGLKKEVSHKLIKREIDLDQLLGSKYVQSNAWGGIADAVSHVRHGDKVLFAGTPCQIAAVKSLLRGDEESLLTVGLICHGTPSSALLKKFIKEQEIQTKSSLIDIGFRSKKFSWRKFAIEMKFDKHQTVYQDMWTGSYMFVFNRNLAHRESCYNCQFRDGRCGADIVLGDFWGIEKVAPDFDDNKGISAVLIYSQKGAKAFDAIESEKIEVEFDGVARKNCNLLRDPQRPSERSRFYRLLEKHYVGWFRECFEKGPLWKRLLRPLYHGLKRLGGLG